MNAIRLFVVARDTEQYGRQWAVFAGLKAATTAYEASAYIVRNAPGEGPDESLEIISGVALYVAPTFDADEARAVVIDGRADIMESEEWSGQK